MDRQLICGTGRPSSFLDELATNATERDVGIVIYSGNFDSLVSHIGSQGMLYYFATNVQCRELTIWSTLVIIQVRHLDPESPT